MTKSIVILVSLSLMAVVAFMASTAGAQCVGCASENWDPMQKLNEVGNPTEQTRPAPTWGPSVVRLTNSQFSKNATDEAADNKPDTSSATTQDAAQTPAPNIDLRNVSAEPNPASPGSAVKIIAVIGGKSASSDANLNAYAIIRNSAGVQVGNVTLEHASGDEYAGDWTASIATGTYTATIEAFLSGVSKTFTDALQIDVTDSDNIAGDNRYKKLG